MKQSLRFRPLILGMVFLSYCVSVHAQIQVSDTMMAPQLLNALFGPGVAISNLQVTGDSVALGSFDGTNSNIGLNAGVVMSTGHVLNIPYNTGAFASTALAQPGDPFLDQLAGGMNTNDACILEFDVVAVCDTIVIRYVFASEEYPTFVGSFNDLFAFFIDGPGYAGMTNIALVPGTTSPVSINHVNPMTNSQYYVANLDTTHAFNGFTVPLTAYALVDPDSTYHFRLSIADDIDQIFDSGIFLQREGICANPGIIAITANSIGMGNTQLMEDESTSLVLRRALSADTDTYIHLNYSGSASAGIDYMPLPDSILLPAGETRVSVPITLMSDCEAEGIETLQIIYADDALFCDGSLYSDTLTFEIMDRAVPDAISLAADTLLCSGESLTIGVETDSNLTYLWSSSVGLADPSAAMTDFSAINDSLVEEAYFSYVLSATDMYGCTVSDSINIGVSPAISLISNNLSDSLCVDETIVFDLQYANVDSWSWDFGDNNSSTEAIPNHSYADSGAYTVQLIMQNDGCEYVEEFSVMIESCRSATSIAEEALGFFFAYPNPATDHIFVEMKAGLAGHLQLINAMGQAVWQQDNVRDKTQIDLSRLADGVYVLQLSTAERRYRQSIVVGQ